MQASLRFKSRCWYFSSSIHPQNISVEHRAKCLCELATERWQENLESLFDKRLSLFIPYLSAFNSFLSVAVSDVLLFLSRALVTFQTCVWFYCGCYNPRTRARAGITAAPAPLSPAFKQAIREFVLVLLLWAEGDLGLGCCLMAMVDKAFGPSFPAVYPRFLFWTCLLNLPRLSPPRMGGFGSMLQIWLSD